MSYKWPDKDPQEQLDYSIDWSRFLGTTSSGSAIGLSSAEWFVNMDTESTLTQAITETQTSIEVADISAFSDLTVGSRVRIGKELLRYGGVTVVGSGGSGVLSLSRGVDGTTASAHVSGSVMSGDRTKLTDATEVNNIQAVSFSNTATVTTIILSLGSTEVSRYKFTCRIATNTSPANYYERTVFLRIKDK
jgi:hypothetical protein